MKRWMWVCTLLALLPMAQAGGGGSVSSCSGAPQIDIAAVQKRLNVAEALWKQRGPSHYALTTRFSGVWMRFTAEVQVADQITGETTTDQLALPGQAIPPPLVLKARPEEAQRYAVSGLFKQVQWLLDKYRPLSPGTPRPRQQAQPMPPLDFGLPPCGILKITFHPRDGHVLLLQYDNFAVIDDEFLLTTSALAPEP